MRVTKRTGFPTYLYKSGHIAMRIPFLEVSRVVVFFALIRKMRSAFGLESECVEPKGRANFRVKSLDYHLVTSRAKTIRPLRSPSYEIKKIAPC